MKPSDIGLAVYRHHFRNAESGEWQRGGFSLAIPHGLDSEEERYEPTDDVSDEIGGLAVYLFKSENQRNAFILGLHSAGDDLSGCAKGMTSLGCPGIIREFNSRESFTARTRIENRTHIAVFDYRENEIDQVSQVMPVYHRQSKNYGGHIAASPEFMLCLVDQRSEKGEAAIGLWPAKDKTGENQLLVSACIDTYPGGARTVPHIRVHHHSGQRRLFRLYRHSSHEHLLVPDPTVKFKPHLMPSGTMGFIVSDEQSA